MKEIIDWLVSVKASASKIYYNAALRLYENVEVAEFCKCLSKEEKEHYDLMMNAYELIKDRKDHSTTISLAEHTKQEVEDLLLLHEKSIADGNFTEESLIDLLINFEFSEWNNLFVHVVNMLDLEHKEYVPIVAKMQQHKRGIERFIESQPGYAFYLNEIKELPKIWEEKILVVDDDVVTLDLLTTIVEDEGIIERASNGEEALKKLDENYYAAIVTDFDMPIMNGIDFYNEAVARYSNIKERFLFFSGSVDEECYSFLKNSETKFLQKPSHIKVVRKAVVGIIAR